MIRIKENVTKLPPRPAPPVTKLVGRPRIHKSNAQKQAAYRAALKKARAS